MKYLMIIIAAVMFSFQFVFHDGFRRENGSDWNSSLKFTFYTSVAGLLALLIINKFHIEFSLFSLATASVYTIVCILSSYSSIKAFLYANLSVYSVFSMIGGMLLPFLYGIMGGEAFKTTRLVCCLLISLAVIMSINKGEHSSKAIKYYMLVFFLNGMVGVISKFHQSYPALCVDSGSFMILTRITGILFCLVLLLCLKKRNFTVNKKALIYTGLYAILNSVGNLLLLIALLYLPASVQYPIVTGGVIVCSTVIVIIRREKITKRELLAAAIAFVATIFMAI